MKDLKEFKPQESEGVKKLAMDIMQMIYSRSQENLTQDMPWGDKDFSGQGRKPMLISDQSTLLLSAIPPYWENENRLVMRYDAPHAKWVEYGTPPHPVAASNLVGWAKRKLGKKGKDAIRTAFAVATNIRKNGVPPHPFMRPAINDTERHFNMKPK